MTPIPDFEPFPKIPRLNRDIVVTEKIDGTNATVCVVGLADILEQHDKVIAKVPDPEDPDGIRAWGLLAGSRKRWITPEDDNFGFASWVVEHAEDLVRLGPGRHSGEWWGKGIQRGYDLDERRFSLFNTAKWRFSLSRPMCCGVVPVIYEGPRTIYSPQLETHQDAASWAMHYLRLVGSVAARGYDNPEGIMVYHTAANSYMKATLQNDEKPKGQA